MAYDDGFTMGPSGGDRGGVSILPTDILHRDLRFPVFSALGSLSSFDSGPEREDKLDVAEWLGDIAASPVPDELGVGSSLFLATFIADGGTCGTKLI